MNENINQVIINLSSPNPDIREEALYEIGLRRPENALEIITPLLSDTNPDVRGTAAFNLGELQDQRVIPYLIHIVKDDPSETVRRDALSALDNYESPEIFLSLIEEVYRPKRSREPRQIVAKQLRKYNMNASVEALIKLLEDDDNYVRIFAIDSLLELNRPDLRVLWDLLVHDAHPYISSVAKKARSALDNYRS